MLLNLKVIAFIVDDVDAQVMVNDEYQAAVFDTEELAVKEAEAYMKGKDSSRVWVELFVLNKLRTVK